MAGMSLPLLVHFRVSHYNEKVRWALDFKGVAHRREALIPGFHVPRARRLSGQSLLPILIVDGRAIFDSPRILQEIERLYPDPPLYPGRPEERERALALEALFDTEAAPDIRRLFWWSYSKHMGDAARMATEGEPSSTRVAWRVAMAFMLPFFRARLGMGKGFIRRARASLPTYFDRLASEVGPSGYLVGNRFTVADLAVASILSGIVRPPEFPYPLPEPIPPELAELQASTADHPGARWVRDIYARHRGVSAEV